MVDFGVFPPKVGKPTSEAGEPRARLRKIFWYQDTGYPVHRCFCVSISHPTPPQVAWWCDVRMCDLWWYGGEVAVRINNTLDRLEGSADLFVLRTPFPSRKIGRIAKSIDFWIFFLYGRWEDLDRWKWVVIDVGVILDTSASHSENCVFRQFFQPLLQVIKLFAPTPPIPQDPHPPHPYTPG